MKILHKFILKSYLGPFILTFFIAIFILLMQFLWKYVDDFVGKGLEWYIIAELLFYSSATFVPLALPLAVLLSSIMTFGNLAEHYELAALKSAGISLQKIMFPLFAACVIISLSAFVFSNYILPVVNLKMHSLLYDVRHQKPALDIREGVFYNGIDDYTLKVGKKSKDGKLLYDIMIYDHTDKKGANKLILAKEGKMGMSADERYLLISLYDGHSYEEIRNNPKDAYTRPLLRSSFKEQSIRFDLSAFKLTRTNEDLFKQNYQMLNIKQLNQEIDTQRTEIKNLQKLMQSQLSKELKPANPINARNIYEKPALSFDKLDKEEKLQVIEIATNMARSNYSFIFSSLDEIKEARRIIDRYEVEWHRKYTFSFACLVLFFIGAPLGAIIRKGGLGTPVVVSTLFFLLFHIVSITGEKFVKEGVLPAYQGMWIATIVLLPIGIFLTYKATHDSSLFDTEAYISSLKRFFNKILFRKR